MEVHNKIIFRKAQKLLLRNSLDDKQKLSALRRKRVLSRWSTREFYASHRSVERNFRSLTISRQGNRNRVRSQSGSAYVCLPFNDLFTFLWYNSFRWHFSIVSATATSTALTSSWTWNWYVHWIPYLIRKRPLRANRVTDSRHLILLISLVYNKDVCRSRLHLLIKQFKIFGMLMTMKKVPPAVRTIPTC